MLNRMLPKLRVQRFGYGVSFRAMLNRMLPKQTLLPVAHVGRFRAMLIRIVFSIDLNT